MKYKKDLSMIDTMVEFGADVHVKENKFNPLWWAINQNRSDVVDYLVLKAGVQPTTFYLRKAICSDKNSDLRMIKTLVQSLLQSGTKVDREEIHSFTPLHYAVKNNRIDVADYLIQDLGISVNTRSDIRYGSRTALIESAKKGHADMCERLLEIHGADVSLADTASGCNAVMWAADRGHPGVLEVLLKHGGLAVIDQADVDGETALMYALYSDSESSRRDRCVRVLLSNNANMAPLTDHDDGMTLKDWSEEEGRYDVVDLLEEEEKRRRGELAVWTTVMLILVYTCMSLYDAVHHYII